jgi:hypothetical protein
MRCGGRPAAPTTPLPHESRVRATDPPLSTQSAFGPHTSRGRSRHGIPVRCRSTTPSSTRRCSPNGCLCLLTEWSDSSRSRPAPLPHRCNADARQSRTHPTIACREPPRTYGRHARLR